MSTTDGPGDLPRTESAAGSALPPELSPRSSGHRADPRPHGKRRGRGIGFKLAAVTSAFVVLGSATGYAVSQHYLGEVNHISAFDGVTNRPARVNAPAENILVAGTDNREDLTAEQKRLLHTGSDIYGSRSDTMILFHISYDQQTVTAVSLPRDSLVTIPAWTDDKTGVHHAASRNKLNAAYAYGGRKLTIETIEKATGIHIDHYVEVDLGGFVRMVDAVGGVDVCLPSAVSDKDSNLHLPAGRSHLNGVQGLAFVRARHIYADQDLGRIKAQQKFIGSMVKRATSSGVLLNPLKLNRFLSAALQSLSTDMTPKQIIAQAKQLRAFKPSHVQFLTVPIGNSNYYVPGVGDALLWDKTAAKRLFTNLRDDKPITSTKKSKITVYPGSITIQVLNGAGVQGLGSRAANDLAALGYGMAGVAKNADVTGQTGTVVKYDPTNAAASRTVIAAIPGSTGLAVPGLGKTIDVVVGSTYSGAKAVTVSTGSTTTGPKVRTAADNVCA